MNARNLVTKPALKNLWSNTVRRRRVVETTIAMLDLVDVAMEDIPARVSPSQRRKRVLIRLLARMKAKVNTRRRRRRKLSTVEQLQLLLD